MVHVLLKPGLENFEHYLAHMGNEWNCVVVWTFFGIAFLWDWNENWPFPVLWPLLSFPNLLAYWVQHFHRIIFQVWSSSTGIPSPPLALFIVMLTKAHLTSHSKMSGSRLVITSSWLSGSWRSISEIAFSVDHTLSELSTMTCPSWVALHSMAHSFIELDKAVVHVIRLVSFLWLWLLFCMSSDGEG